MSIWEVYMQGKILSKICSVFDRWRESMAHGRSYYGGFVLQKAFQILRIGPLSCREALN